MLRRVAHSRPRLIRDEAARSQRKPQNQSLLMEHTYIGMLLELSLLSVLTQLTTKKATMIPRSVFSGISRSAMSYTRSAMLLRQSEVPCVLEGPLCSFPPERTEVRDCELIVLRTPSSPEKFVLPGLAQL